MPGSLSGLPLGETSNADVLVRCERLVIGHGGKPLLPAMDLDIRRGRLLLVAGRNGAGKSTWLRTLLGLIPPVAGQLRRAEPAPRMAYVPQSSGLDELLPVHASTVLAWARLRGWSFLWPFARSADRAVCRQALEQAGAESLVSQRYRELSGGQRQRILLARILASEAELVLLDEPTASMDVTAQAHAYERLAALAHERNMAVVVVTHMLGVAAIHADEILFLHRSDNPGDTLIVSGSPATVLSHPRFVRLFGKIETGNPQGNP